MVAVTNRDGMLQMIAVRALFFCTFQFIFVTSRSCKPVFQVKYPRLRSNGATPATDVRNEEDCKNACLTNRRCVSYQIDANPEHSLCWMQLDAANFVVGNLYELSTVTEYVLVNRCSDSEVDKPTLNPDLCVPIFENKNPGWVSRFAVKAPHMKTEDECKAACVTVPICVSYQVFINFRSIFCWLQYDQRKLSKDQMYKSDAIKEYFLVDRCLEISGNNGSRTKTKPKPGENPEGQSAQTEKQPTVNESTEKDVEKPTIKPDLCLPVFENKNSGWVSRFAINVPDPKTEDECKAACVKIPNCVSYQIGRELGGILCWLQYDQQKLSKAHMYQSEAIKEYILVDRCSEPPEQKPSTEDPNACLPVFENKNPGWISRQATSFPDAKTEDECKKTCVRIPACVSYLISRKNGGTLCWIQYNQQQLNKGKLIPTGKIEEHILVDRCQISTDYAEKECHVIMKPSLFGQFSNNAILHASAKDERNCVAACIARSNCISVQFKSTDRNWLCFLQHDFHAFKPESLIYHPNVTEYVIIKRCDEHNACSRGFPLKGWGVPFFRKRRSAHESSGVAEEDRGDEGHHCEVLVQPVSYGQSTAEGVPLKSALTEKDCIAACIADKDCISTQHQGHSSNGSFACFLQNEVKAFESRLLHRPDVTEYKINRRCNKTPLFNDPKSKNPGQVQIDQQVQ